MTPVGVSRLRLIIAPLTIAVAVATILLVPHPDTVPTTYAGGSGLARAADVVAGLSLLAAGLLPMLGGAYERREVRVGLTGDDSNRSGRRSAQGRGRRRRHRRCRSCSRLGFARAQGQGRDPRRAPCASRADVGSVPGSKPRSRLQTMGESIRDPGRRLQVAAHHRTADDRRRGRNHPSRSTPGHGSDDLRRRVWTRARCGRRRRPVDSPQGSQR